MNDLSGLRIQALRFDADTMQVTLANGLRLEPPLTRYPRLQQATPAQRQAWQSTADGHGADWPALVAPVAGEGAGLFNVLDLLWDQRYDHALHRLHAQQWHFEALAPEDRELVALWRMEADINNGGFMQFLCNWGDATCQCALQALAAMGAVRTRESLAGMRGLFDRLEDDPAITSLHDLYGALTEDEQRRLEAFEEAYYAQPEFLARLGLLHYGPEPG